MVEDEPEETEPLVKEEPIAEVARHESDSGADEEKGQDSIDKEESERYRDYERKRLPVDEDRLNRNRRLRRERGRPVEERDRYKSNNRYNNEDPRFCFG